MVFPVWMLNCASPSEHGVAQYCVPAVLYVAQDEWITHGNLLNQLSFCFVYEMVITTLKNYYARRRTLRVSNSVIFALYCSNQKLTQA